MIPLDLENAKFINDGNKINIDLKIKVPEKLYKYYSISNNSINSIKNGTLYFSHAHLLNDIMDGNFMLWDTKEFITEYKKEREIKGTNDHEFSKDILKKLIKPFLECRGILSLADTYKNELIWAHYCVENGYCLELDRLQLENNLKENRSEKDCHFFPVSYEKDLKQINFLEYISFKIVPKNINFESKKVDAILPLLYCFAQKDECWKYEKEWRFLLIDRKFNSISHPLEIIDDEQKSLEDSRKSGGNITINKNVIHRIILAPLFFNNTRFNNHEILNSNMEIYNFKKNNEGKITREFLEVLKSDFKNKIFQVDKVIKKNIVVRDIKYQIDIIDIGETFVKIKKKVVIDQD